jgi:hypothetical protein
MDSTETLSAEHVRSHLLERAQTYIDARKSSLSFISQQAVADSKFLANVKRGENFTIRNYQRVIDWLDAQEAASEQAA